MNVNKKKIYSLTKSRFIKSGLVIFWMTAIFFLSNEPAGESSLRSRRIIDVLNSYQLSFSEIITTFVVRKTAHIFMYFVLGLLLYNLVRIYNLSTRKMVAISIIVAFMYAIADEIHQSFVKGRSGEVRDVIIDTIGAALGVGLIYLLSSRHKAKLLQNSAK